MITRKIARQLAVEHLDLFVFLSRRRLLVYFLSLPIMSDGDKKVRTESKRLSATTVSDLLSYKPISLLVSQPDVKPDVGSESEHINLKVTGSVSTLLLKSVG